MRSAPLLTRSIAAALLALLLTLRSLAPAGFMPAFEHGAVTIVACPDAQPAAPTGMHYHGDHKTAHQPCPYAAASSLGATGMDWAPLVAPLPFAVAFILGRTFLFIERGSGHERPPLRGPPITA